MRTIIAYKQGFVTLGPLAKRDRPNGAFQRAFDVLRDAEPGWYQLAWPAKRGAFQRVTREEAERHPEHGDWARQFTTEALP